MLKPLKKSLLTGLGLVSMAKDKVSEAVDDLAKKGDISAEQGEKLLKQVQAKFDEEEARASQWVREQVEKVVSKMDLVTNKKHDELAARVAALEAKCGCQHPDPTEDKAESSCCCGDAGAE
ncbi:MAG TPA: hypothetical protein PL033_01275 [Candidatus Brocadiia bacterium]|nr:hypothetical protein [Candidatus Brocadiia bacterium]